MMIRLVEPEKFSAESLKAEFELLTIEEKVNIIMEDATKSPYTDAMFSIKDETIQKAYDTLIRHLLYLEMKDEEVIDNIIETIDLLKDEIPIYKIIKSILMSLNNRKGNVGHVPDIDLKKIIEEKLCEEKKEDVLKEDNNEICEFSVGDIANKKVIINGECIGCGICSELENIFIENPNGTVYVSPSACITEQNVEMLNRIVGECPAKCISFIEVKEKFKSLEELKDALTKDLGEYTFPMPSRTEYDFNKEEYRVIPRRGSGEHRYEYSTEKKAISAGLTEFNRCMYSQMKPIIIELLVDYKNKKLMQFVKYERIQGNYYYDKISQVEQMITEYLMELERLSGKEVKNKEDFSRINCKPSFDVGDCRHVAWDITNFEELDFTGSILGNIDSYYEYELYINTDDMDRYEGRREKTYYCYTVSEACEQLAKDILWATNYVMNHNEATERIVQNVVKDSVKNIEKEIHEKYMKILNVVGNLLY